MRQTFHCFLIGRDDVMTAHSLLIFILLLVLKPLEIDINNFLPFEHQIYFSVIVCKGQTKPVKVGLYNVSVMLNVNEGTL